MRTFALALAFVPAIALGQASVETSPVPALAALANGSRSELAEVVSRYSADRSALYRRYGVDYSPAQTKRLETFTTQWLGRLRELDFDKLTQEGQVDYVLLRHELEYEQYQLGRTRQQLAEMQAYTPFATTIFDLMETRRELVPVNQQEAGRALATLAKQVDSVRRTVERLTSTKVDTTITRVRDSVRTARFVGFRTVGFVESLRTTLGQWYRYYSGYDPLFTWWTEDPYKRTDDALEAYAKVVRERVVGIREGDADPIIGDPIGAAGLTADLAHEMMPYTPERLIQIAEREYAWCEAEMKKASREMGFGDDWRKAVEKVKNTYVDPGKQPDLIRDLAREAEQYVEQHELVTVPPLAKEIWRMEMMTPEQAVDFLVDRVGHERANAEAEVRRSFNGTYPPLYQVAYMIGGLQFGALHRELVESGRMTNRQFHDAILQGGRMPVEMVRARLENRPLTRDYRAQWRFDDGR